MISALSFRRLALNTTAMLAAAALSAGFATTAIAQATLTGSTITAVAKQIGVPISGSFKKFNADITFNPAQPSASSASFTVDVASYDMGMPDYNKEVTGKTWFNAAQFPQANFVSSAITASGSNSYTVAGKLTLKGKTVDVTIPVTVKTAGATQTFDGSFPIKRTVFGIGDGEWKDTSVVADDVVIKFHIVNTVAAK